METETITKHKNSKELFATVLLIFITIFIFILLFFKVDKFKTIDLNSSDIKVIDDRNVRGESIATVLRTNQGLEFNCQVINSYLEQPYCELHINVQNLGQSSALNGLDLSSYDQIGLWLSHNHPSQPGTRIELHNFNADYSIQDKRNSLKHNTLEYLEAYATDPVWLNLNDFAIPQWWHNSHNLSLDNGGTDFSNIYTIVLGPSAQVKEGKYQLTIKRIELKGSYISSASLISILIIIWSAAGGYFFHHLTANDKEVFEASEQPTHIIEFGAMSCHVTGALNRIGLRKCFDQLPPSDLKHLSVIFLSIDYFSSIQSKHSQKTVDKILQKFVLEVNSKCRAGDTITRWNSEEFLLVCPDTTLEQAVGVSDKIRSAIQENTWPKEIRITCSTGVAQMYDEHLNDLISRANKALHKAKSSGNNKTAAA